MSALRSALRLVRFEHSIMLVIAVLGAEMISGGIPQMPALALSLITPIFVGASAFAINDYFDVEVDRRNRKARPLVSGELKPSDALAITAACIIIGVGAGILINIYCAVIAAAFAALSLLYSYRLKEMPLVGNAYVALSMSIPFIFGSYVVGSPGAAILSIFSLVFLAGLAREIDGTVRDYEGDVRERKARTLPAVIGKKASAWLAMMLYVAAAGISAYLFVAVPPLKGNFVYLPIISVVDIMILYSGAVFAAGKKRLYGQVRNVSLAAMALALVCILISVL